MSSNAFFSAGPASPARSVSALMRFLCSRRSLPEVTVGRPPTAANAVNAACRVLNSATGRPPVNVSEASARSRCASVVSFTTTLS